MTHAITTLFLRDTHHGGDGHQPQRVAAALASFISAATTSVDVCIYDLRLSDTLGAPLVHALTAAADRGVRVRVAYDAGKPDGGAAAARFVELQADPAPPGTADWVSRHLGGTKVLTEAIASAPQLMHDKYVVRDAPTAAHPHPTTAAVWTGSVNFTDDAWTRQESNVVTVADPVVAAGFAVDFEQLWAAKKLKGTGRGDGGSAAVGGATVAWDFSPGDGPAIEAALVAMVDGASTRIVLAAMVLTSHPLLAALRRALARGVPVSGIYDSGQMGPIVAQWKKIPADATVVADFEAVAAHLSAKRSTPYSPTSVHDFMHHKVLVADGTVATGSYNFSANAEKNAENQLRITDRSTADAYAAAVATIARAYSA